MTVNWKLLAVAAGGAFLLSLLVGAIGGVGFGTLLLRALLWALIFGGLAAGIEYALKNFLPELLSAGSAENEQPSEGGVDITLADENPHARNESPAAGDDAGAADDIDDFMSETAGEDDSADTGTVASESRSDGADEVEELEEVGGPTDSGSELPSFDGVEATFASAEPISAGADSVPSSVDVLGSDEDPEVVARAVRTLMNKDQEG